MFGVSDVVGSSDLLGVNGQLANRKQQFLLDSGASCNFVSQDLLHKLGLDYDLCISQNVRLADGQQLSTRGKLVLRCQLGPLTYLGTFYVLQARVPLILGMSFFSEVSPIIDWAARTVHVRRGQQLLKLPIVKYNAKGVHSVQKTCASTDAHSNPFGVLSVDEIGNDFDLSSNVEAAGKQPSSTSHTGRLVAAQPVVEQKKHVLCEQKTCVQCGKKMKATRVNERCYKCDNGSFSHI